ncbi:hypothetical protein F4818DRAFT_432010 [Hypoxylon cercidicola]|nr:hypothetical protein F4818DRAFT_432010 [Hypoxylon cercidicola]
MEELHPRNMRCVPMTQDDLAVGTLANPAPVDGPVDTPIDTPIDTPTDALTDVPIDEPLQPVQPRTRRTRPSPNRRRSSPPVSQQIEPVSQQIERPNREIEMDSDDPLEEPLPPYSRLPPASTPSVLRAVSPGLIRGRNDSMPSSPNHPADTTRCANCGRIGHGLSICVGPPASDGAIHGCPCCNTLVHSFDACPRERFMNPDQVYFFLVLSRGNRPPISTEQRYLQMATERNAIQSYPWTRAYSRCFDYSAVANFDYSSNDPGALPSDPATCSQDSILRNIHSIFERPLTAGQFAYLTRVYGGGVPNGPYSSSSSSNTSEDSSEDSSD